MRFIRHYFISLLLLSSSTCMVGCTSVMPTCNSGVVESYKTIISNLSQLHVGMTHDEVVRALGLGDLELRLQSIQFGELGDNWQTFEMNGFRVSINWHTSQPVSLVRVDTNNQAVIWQISQQRIQHVPLTQ
jgi:hypothetical protein